MTWINRKLLLYRDTGLFQGESITGKHTEWMKMGTALVSLFGQEDALIEQQLQTEMYRPEDSKWKECNNSFKKNKKPDG